MLWGSYVSINQHPLSHYLISNRICTPLIGDQPYVSLYIDVVHDLGYELFNARNDLGTRPIYRKGDWAPPCTVEAIREEFLEILEKASGDDGKRKRENVQKMKEQIADSWKSGGAGWKEIQKIFDVMS